MMLRVVFAYVRQDGISAYGEVKITPCRAPVTAADLEDIRQHCQDCVDAAPQVVILNWNEMEG